MLIFNIEDIFIRPSGFPESCQKNVCRKNPATNDPENHSTINTLFT